MKILKIPPFSNTMYLRNEKSYIYTQINYIYIYIYLEKLGIQFGRELHLNS
jgi:hypothetical protein